VPGQAPKPVTAAALGGSVSGDLQLSLTDAHPFDLNVRLADGDLADVLRCSANIDRPITGRVYSTLRLSGNRNGVHTHRGTGAVRLRNANIYELPLMVALLKIPRLQPADRTAFTTSDIDYRVHGEHIYIDRINFDGDAVSLRGNGEVSRDRRINLNFYTIVGRHEVPLPIIQPLLGEAARQFMMIHVTGTLDKPVTTPEMLPGLNETLQQLFPEELTGQPNSARPPPSVPHQAGPSRRGY